MPDYKTYDLIVAGGGTAGLIAAARLAERGVHPKTGEKLKIAVLEAGPYWKGEQRAGYGHPLRRQMTPQINWEDFATVPNFPWMFGLQMVGGCSMHWGANAFLPEDIDYEQWVQETGVDWTKEKIKESLDDVVNAYHVHESPDEAFGRGDWLFKQASESLGFKVLKYTHARKNCLYCGFRGDGHGCKYDARGTSLWYAPIAEQNGVEIIPNAMVEKVIIEKKGARGVVKGVFYKEKGVTKEARADKVVVSCGYAGSPVLLAKSGYGPRNEAPNLIVENANVGKNLDGDTRAGFPALFDEQIKEDSGRGSIGAFYFFTDVGADAVWRVRIASPDIGALLYPHDAALNELAPQFGKAHMDYMRTAITRVGGGNATVTKPASNVKGSVNLQSGAKNYPGSEMIDKRLRESFELIREIYKRMGAKKIGGARLPKTFKAQGGGHSNGTCRAGVDRKNSVIDSKFESHDVDGLFIADASSIPRAISNNVGLIAAVMGAYAARRIVAAYFTRGA